MQVAQERAQLGIQVEQVGGETVNPSGDGHFSGLFCGWWGLSAVQCPNKVQSSLPGVLLLVRLSFAACCRWLDIPSATSVGENGGRDVRLADRSGARAGCGHRHNGQIGKRAIWSAASAWRRAGVDAGHHSAPTASAPLGSVEQPRPAGSPERRPRREQRASGPAQPARLMLRSGPLATAVP